MKLPTDARWPQCPDGHARDSARCLAPLLPSDFHARILLDASVFFHGAHGSPGARRAFLGVFSRPGWLHTRRKRLFGPARSFDRQFGLVDGVRRGDNTRFAPRRVSKRRRSRGFPDLRRRRRGATMLNTPVFARSKRGYVWTGRGTPVFLCMTQAKLCKTIGRRAPDTQIGGDMRRDTGSGAPSGIATRVTKLWRHPNVA